jgi:uncharacterized protein (TIGR02145 family)
MKSKILSNTLILVALVILVISCKKKNDKPLILVTDIEGNTYKTVKIDTQVWMAENLRTTRYNDGTEIPLVTNTEAWGNLTTPGYCWYNNDEVAYKDPYGALYNGHTVSTGKLCPTGWHVPTQEEWQRLRVFLNDTITGGGKMKEAGTTHWLTPNKGADNSSGFTALGAGIRYFEGSFSSVLYYTSIWSSTEIGSNDEWYLSLYFGDAIVKINHRSKKHGFSVRCVKD